MSKAKLQAATVGGTAAEAEASFYEAMQTGDLERMMACWSDEDEVVCVHPGGERLVGLAAIRASFEALFSTGAGVGVVPTQVCKVESLTSAMHNLIEQAQVRTDTGVHTLSVVVTNVYQRTAQGWRMVAHHGSPGLVGMADSGAVVMSDASNVIH